MRAFLLLSFLATTLAAQTFEISSSEPQETPGRRSEAQIAELERGYLVAWREKADPDLVNTSIHAMRVDRDGRPMDRGDLVLGENGPFVMASSGGEVLVALASCGYAECYDGETRFVRVANEGAWPGRATLPGRVYAIAPIGDNKYVAVFGQRPPYALVLLNRIGDVVSEPLSLPGESWWMNVRLAASRDGRVGVLWTTGRHVRFAIVDEEDVARQRIVYRDPGAAILQETIDVGAADDGYLAWWGGRFVALDRSGRPAGEFRSPGFESNTSLLASTGTRHFVLYTESDPNFRLRYREIDTADGVSSTSTVIADSVSLDRGAYAATSERDGGLAIVYAVYARSLQIARIDSNGALVRGMSGANIVRRRPTQSAPSIARCGFGYAVTWIEPSASHDVVRFRRFSSDGRPLDPPGRRLPNADDVEPSAPLLACSGDAMLVSWTETRSRTTYRMFVVSGDGEPKLFESGTGTVSTMAATSDGFVAVVNGTPSVVRRYSSSGELRVERAIPPRSLQPHIAWSGDRGALFWTDNLHTSIHGILLDRGFGDVGTEHEYFVNVVRATLTSFLVASSSDGWLAAMSLQKFDCAGCSVQSFDLSSDLTLLESRHVGGQPDERSIDGAAWNGCQWELYFTDHFGVNRGDIPGKSIPAIRRRVAADAAQRFVLSTVVEADGVPRLFGRIESPVCIQ